MKEMKRENAGIEGALVKKSQEESRQTESGPTGKAQLRKILTKELSSGEKGAGKAAWKIPVCYVLWAALSVLFTGLIALCLGMNGSVSGETGKTIVEILSSLLGSIYVSFLLGRWKALLPFSPSFAALPVSRSALSGSGPEQEAPM